VEDFSRLQGGSLVTQWVTPSASDEMVKSMNYWRPLFALEKESFTRCPVLLVLGKSTFYTHCDVVEKSKYSISEKMREFRRRTLFVPLRFGYKVLSCELVASLLLFA
jgi:hypothetical protein